MVGNQIIENAVDRFNKNEQSLRHIDAGSIRREIEKDLDHRRLAARIELDRCLDWKDAELVAELTRRAIASELAYMELL